MRRRRAVFGRIRDLYNYAANEPRKHLPEFQFAFVQNGSHLIPAQQGLIITGHPYWNYLIGPGRVWTEKGDKGWSRASIPFALVQRNQNAIHNGVMMFLFNDKKVSAVRYQITQETCTWFKCDMWGQLKAKYTPAPVANAFALKDNHALEVMNRLQTKPLSALTTDFPNSGVNVSVFGSGLTGGTSDDRGFCTNGALYYRRQSGTPAWGTCPSFSAAAPFFLHCRNPLSPSSR